MKTNRKTLMRIAQKVTEKKHLMPEEITFLLSFEKSTKQRPIVSFLKRLAIPLSLVVGFLFYAFPQDIEGLTTLMPPWTNFPPHILVGVDYLWDILGEPVRKANIVYHLPNIVLYSFGVVGLKKLFEAIEKRTWLDRVLGAQKMINEQIEQGILKLQMKKGFSLLFVGKGDFIGMQFCLNHIDETVTISEVKPSYTHIWNYYNVDTLYEDLKNVMVRAGAQNAGEYIFFPVKDDQIFLPGEKAYDLSPHKLDIICSDIRMIEKELKWKPKRILIIGDKFHKSFVRSEDEKKTIPGSSDSITLKSIAKKYENVTLLDPSDVVLKKIIRIAMGRRIVLRATKEGLTEYKKRFYSRLKELGYKQLKSRRGVLTIGYDLFEDQTEQQTLSRTINDYYPVVLSKNVYDALIRNGYRKDEFLYVPELVIQNLTRAAAKQ